uniref:Uncharacterized protein n=1 Tax=Hyaloperonospora arabidopsidis (strain Emoy2) TaxID=559515 RepID=M4B2N4_HYAAE
MATKTIENEPAFTLPQDVQVDNQYPVVLGGRRFAALEQRSKSETFICTAKGVVFQDTKCQKYQSKLNSLMALAADSSSSQSNVLLAKKALRYRKVLERHCLVAGDKVKTIKTSQLTGSCALRRCSER